MSENEAALRLRTAGRNDDCPCGSGKKYKKCHLREDEEASSRSLATANAARAEAAEAKERETGVAAPGPKPGERPRSQAATGPSGVPKGPRSHKPINTPRKAV